MKISGFTIARNAVKFNYPILESIQSILPLCNEFIVNIGDSEDDTRALIQSIKSPKIKIIENKWDFSQGKEVLSYQTNLALKACTGDWAFYLQSDEVIHQKDFARLKKTMKDSLDNQEIDAIRFRWFHFYGSYYRYRIDRGWYQKQDRIIRNNGEIESFGDAYAFCRKDGKDLKSANSHAFLYHYGWVQPQEIMADRRKNAEKIGFVSLKEEEKEDSYDYGDLGRFEPYFGSHPKVMEDRIRVHALSQEDKARIAKDYWWHPMRILGVRFKTGKRIKVKIE